MIQGTSKELITKGLALNGKPVLAPYLSVLAGFAVGIKAVGTIPKPEGQKGKPQTVYECHNSEGIEFTIKLVEV